MKTIGHWIQHWKQHGDVEDESGRGRKRKTTEEADHAIIAAAEQQPFTTPRILRAELELDDVSAKTVRRRLNEAGLYGRVSKHEYPYTPTHLRKRLSFAGGYGNWTEDQWDTVLWSDETSIELSPHGQVWVQRPIGEAFNPKYMRTQQLHSPGASLWGCMAASGMGEYHIYTDELDRFVMRDILSQHLLSSAARLFPPGSWWLQQDGDPAHTSGLVQQWLFTHGVQCIDWPPYSPDLNPIENVWNDIKRRVEKRNAKDIEQLKQHLAEEWEVTDPILLATLVHTMPKRCKDVVANHGHKTKY